MFSSYYIKYIKGILDIVFALLAFIVLSPLLILISIYCFINFDGRVFFKQIRIGKNEKSYTIYKFITMRSQSVNGEMTDTERSTQAGQFLRKFSLDEIPQIINILKGEMSWIGPRPLLAKYLPYYKNEEKLRHTVKPGISGLAQIKGRNQLNWDNRLALDVTYVKTLSLKHDALIVAKTILILFTKANPVVDPRLLMMDLDEERNHFLLKPQMPFNLRKPTLDDTEQLLEVKNNINAAVTLENDNTGFNIADIKNWINFHNSNSNNDIFVIEHINAKLVIGHAGLYNIQNGMADFGILIGLPTYWNRGIGTTITKQIIAIGFIQHNLNTINLKVLASHSAAIAVYKKIGFKEIDLKPGGTIKNGKPADLLIMQIHKP